MHISLLHQRSHCVASLDGPAIQYASASMSVKTFPTIYISTVSRSFFIQPGQPSTAWCSHTVWEISTHHLSRQFSVLLLLPFILLRGPASTRLFGAAALSPLIFPEIQIFWGSAHALGQFPPSHSPQNPSLLATRTLPTQAITCGLLLPRSSPETRQSKVVTLWPGLTSEEGVCTPVSTETFQRERGGRGRTSLYLKSNENQTGQLSCACAYRAMGQMWLTPNCLARGELSNTVHFQSSSESASISGWDQQEAI